MLVRQLQVPAGMKKLVKGCPALAARPEFRAISNLRSIDAIAVRIWFDRKLSTRFPANVLAGFENSAGGTFFNLNDLQVSPIAFQVDWVAAAPLLFLLSVSRRSPGMLDAPHCTTMQSRLWRLCQPSANVKAPSLQLCPVWHEGVQSRSSP